MNAPTNFPPMAAAGNGWTVRRNDDDVLQVYRVLANAGPDGISRADVRSKLPGLDDDAITQHLQELRRKRHGRFQPGPNGNLKTGLWYATNNAFPGEALPGWAEKLPVHDEYAPPPGAAEEVVQRARSVPASVFALGLKIAAEVDIDAAHKPQPAADPAPPPATEPQAPPAAEPATPPTAAAQPRPALQLAPKPQAEPIVVALDNLGRLLVHEAPDAPVVLSPSATRVLFKYLDDTCGGFLVDALP